MKVQAIKMNDIFNYDIIKPDNDQINDPLFFDMEYSSTQKEGLSYDVNLGPLDPCDLSLGDEVYNIPVTRKLEMFRLFPGGPLHRFNDPAIIMQWSQINVCGDRVVKVIQLWAWKGIIYKRAEEYYNALPNEELSKILFNAKEHEKMLDHVLDDVQLLTCEKGLRRNEANV